MSDNGRGPALKRDGIDRRAFLRTGGIGLGACGLSGSSNLLARTSPKNECSVILLLLVGGPSQLETWDPKPDAPVEIRGPFDSIATQTPGVRVCEHLPELAARMDKLALVRSLHHNEAPIHETGLQLLQTGRVARSDEHPHFGAAAAKSLSRISGAPISATIPGPIGDTGVMLPKGQSAGGLSDDFCPVFLATDRRPTSVDGRAVRKALQIEDEKTRVREAYGPGRFGRDCLLARRLVEAGVRVVTVNMFDTVFNRVSWDSHGSRPFSTFDDYRREVLPTFDRAFSALIDDLESRGMLETTMVAAIGEFGRTPRINASGGRDHWPGVWSAAMAGAGIQGGRVIGASDARAAEPVDRPVSPQEWLATMQAALGVSPDSEAGSLDASPIWELFS